LTATMKKYADVVRAYLDGAEVQMCHPGMQIWYDDPEPTWDSGFMYRIKPKEPRIVERYLPVGFDGGHHTNGVYWEAPHVIYITDDTGRATDYAIIALIKLRCNEETGEIISVELIKESK